MSRSTTLKRHEKIREQIESKVIELERQGIQGPVSMACRQLAVLIGYTENTLRKIFYEY